MQLPSPIARAALIAAMAGAASTGCHTAGAVRALAAPSPVIAIDVTGDGGRSGAARNAIQNGAEGGIPE